MAINGLGSFDMMSTYNRIRVNDQAVSETRPVASTQAEELSVKEQPQEQKQPELKVNLNLDGMRSRSSYNLESITRDFAKREAFSISNVDDKEMEDEMLKAVSTMEKDQSLQQFQYFVGESNVVFNDADGIVIRK